MILKAPPQNFVKNNASSHWYEVTPDGTVLPRYEATLREARKERLFPSPTTIEKDIRANSMLMRWVKNEIAKAFVNNPRFTGENEDDYAARCLAISDTIAREAAQRGEAIHKAIEEGHTEDPVIKPFLEKYLPWHEENILETIGVEVPMADRRIGVAGRVDRIAIHKNYGRVIIDYKTQRVKKTPGFYESFPRQLSFYAKADQLKNNLEQVPRILSVVLDSQEPHAPYEKLYTLEEQHVAHQEFLAQAWLWFTERDFWPTNRWGPTFDLP